MVIEGLALIAYRLMLVTADFMNARVVVDSSDESTSVIAPPFAASTSTWLPSLQANYLAKTIGGRRGCESYCSTKL
jgi:hypothetical protein